MPPLTATLLASLATVIAAMLALWGVSLVRRDVSIVDPFWGTGFVLIAWLTAALHWPPSPRVLLIDGLVTAWGLRLSVYLLWRNRGQGEDRRYAAMREHHGSNFWWVSLFTVFLLQGALLWFISLPLQVVTSARMAEPLGWMDAVGGALWLAGVSFETIGDWQLAQFRANQENAGRVLDRGLWRYTRHPNYFGDFCVWWAFYVIAAAGGAAWTFASPLVMSILLLRISGVTLLESTMNARRPEYAAYQQRTNAFFPGPQKVLRQEE